MVRREVNPICEYDRFTTLVNSPLLFDPLLAVPDHVIGRDLFDRHETAIGDNACPGSDAHGGEEEDGVEFAGPPDLLGDFGVLVTLSDQGRSELQILPQGPGDSGVQHFPLP